MHFQFAASAARPAARSAEAASLEECEKEIADAAQKLMSQLGRRVGSVSSEDVSKEIQPIFNQYQAAQGMLLNQYGQIRSRYRAA